MVEENEPPLNRLLYVSAARRLMSDHDLRILLNQAREANRLNGITGMLIYAEGHFVQYIEGPESAVTTLIQRIERDHRHHGLIRLLEGPLQSRAFTDWTMGFRSLRRAEHPALDGLVNLIQQPLDRALPANPPRDIAVFMESFYRNSLSQADDAISA